MAMVLNSIVIWLKEFKNVWLPETIPHENPLLPVITTKLLELEQIIIDHRGIETCLDREEYYRLKLLHDHSSSDDETERRPMLVSTHPTGRLERSLPTPPDIHPSMDDEENPEAQAKRSLLEQSDVASSSDEENNTKPIRPVIRLKRLTGKEVEKYLSEHSNPSESDESSSSCSDDYRIRIRSRPPPYRNRTRSNQSASSNNVNQHSKDQNQDIVISYGGSTNMGEPSPDEPMSLPDQSAPSIMNQEERDVQTQINHEDPPSTSVVPVEMETEAAPTVESESVDSATSTEPDVSAGPVTVPTYSHLLTRNGLSSSSDLDTSNMDDTDTNRKKKSKRCLSSSSSESTSKTKRKSSSVVKKRAFLTSLSSSPSDDDSDETITRQSRSKSSSPNNNDPSRIRINRTSSSSSSSEMENSQQRKRSTRSKDTTSSPTKGQSSSQGRKNIRKILDDKELDIETIDAIEAEKERRNRIAARQKEYNDSLLEQSSFFSTDTDETNGTKTNRLILELNKETNEAIIEVSPKLVACLKPHQLEGVRFLWNNVFESIEAIKKKNKQSRNGCILAHCMGLGKTLQVISFIHTILKYSHLTQTQTCLVLCPINAALNWTNEFELWLESIDPPIEQYQLATVKPHLRFTQLNHWFEHGGVMIMGYEMYRRLANGVGVRNKELKTNIQQCLVDPGPDIVIADEGHILKNSQTALARCLAKIKTSRRVVLTGTPLQNNLVEYYCMVSFIKPNLLGTQQEYINRFVNPIENGQHRDSNEADVRLMKRRACVLHELLTGFVDRKDYSLLKQYLPPKCEYIISVRLSDLQSTLYEMYLKQQVNQEQRTSVLRKDFKSAKLFADFNFLQKIWTHPYLLYPLFIDRWKKRNNQEEENFIDDNDTDTMFSDTAENSDEKTKKSKKKKNTNQCQDKKEIKRESSFRGFLIDNIEEPAVSSQRRPSHSSTTTTIDSESTENEPDADENGDDDIEFIRTYPTRSRTVINPTTEENAVEQPWINDIREQFWFPILDSLPKENEFDLQLSGKFLLLKSILDKCSEIGDKVLVFSRSLYTLNYIEKWLKYLQLATERDYEKQCETRRQMREILSTTNQSDVLTCTDPIPEPMKWIRDEDYFRMDGQTDVISRKRYAKAFNDLSNDRARLFLISTVAGGIGINLTGSNRVILFDASWNPSHDTQAIFRSYRFGQKKPVYIYRLLAHGTMEEKIYQRQVVKQSLSQRVVDDHQLDRHFTQNDIKELYKFQKEPLPDVNTLSSLITEDTPIPKDHLLLDLIYDHHRWIHSFHSHDSLLENKIDEGLTADERRRALEEYESLKSLPDPRQLALQRLQQQQQLNALIARQQQIAHANRLNNAHGVQPTWPNSSAMNPTTTMPTSQDYLAILKMMMNDAQMAPRFPNRPLVPRPTTTASSANDIICLESDEEETQTNKQ